MFALTVSLVSLPWFAACVGAQCQSHPGDFKFPPTFVPSVRGRVIFNGLVRPRGIKFDQGDPSNLLVADRGTGVIALTQKNDGSCNGWERKVVVANADLTHGIDVRGTQLFASSSDSAYLWSYNAASVSVSGEPQVIVKGMGGKEHNTRTLLYQPGSTPHLIVTRGSDSNLDLEAANITSGHSQIRRFALNSSMPTGGYDWQQGELLAWGMRNAVGIALSQDGTRLWEVENSADEIFYKTLDVHEDNPAEELNMIDLSKPGAFYGYPDCLTVWNMSSVGGPSNFNVGDQFSINGTGGRDDAWCSDQNQNTRPRLSLQAHMAPLDIKFFAAANNGESGGLPRDWITSAFVTTHGSWDRTNPTGYSVIRIPWSGNEPAAAATAGIGYHTLMQPPDLSKCRDSCIRPVGLDFDSTGRMFVSSDATGEIFVVENGSGAMISAASVPFVLPFGVCVLVLYLLFGF